MAWAPDYITADELESYQHGLGETVDDTENALAVTAASRAIDDHCNRQFGKLAAAAAWTYPAQYRWRTGLWVVAIDDLMTQTDFAVEVSGTPIGTDFRLEPSNAAAKGEPWTRLVILSTAVQQPIGDPDEVEVTGIWGWTAVPAPVKLATKLQANRFASRRDSPLGVTGSADTGGEMRLLAKVDPDLKVALGNFTRKTRPR